VLLVLSRELEFVFAIMGRKASIIRQKRKRGRGNGRRKSVPSSVARNERDHYGAALQKVPNQIHRTKKLHHPK
jgi:hypothetical protein